jgi:hypothetical protein
MKSSHKIVAFSILIASALSNVLPAASAVIPGVVGKAKLDSVTMTMGSKSALRVEFTGNFDKNAHIDINSDEWNDVEISPLDSVDMKTLGDGRRQLRALFMVQAFDSGLYSLPPIYLIAGKDTVASDSPVLKVDPISLDTANVVFEGEEPVDVKVHDYTDVVDDKTKFWDFMPDWITAYWWWILLSVVVIAAFIFIYMKWLRHGRIPLMPVKKPVPPYVLAVEKLNDLQQKKLWQKGAEKEYYTQLTDILRGYLSGRFGINAMEMTTPQIMSAISGNEEAMQFASYVNDVLREADFVKFAKAKPDAAENELAFTNVRQFVELTKPEEKPEEPENTQTESENINKENNTKAE